MIIPEFNEDFFINNRKSLRRAIKEEVPIVVTANGLLQRGADVSYPFSQDANFWYLTGIPDPDITLVMDGDREFLIVPIREGVRVVFDGQIDDQSLTRISGIKDIVNEASGWKRLDAILERTGRLATLAPASMYIEQFGMYANPARYRLMDRIRQHTQEIELIDIRPEMADLRMIKQEVEIQAIQSAVYITNQTLKEVLSKPAGTYRYEYQVEADISRGFRFYGSQGHSFEPIVAGGVRACTLHNITNSAPLKAGELVVIDVGTSVQGYSSDITRVYANGRPSQRQRDVFSAVKEAHQYALSLLKPGVGMKSYEQKVARFIGGKLKQLGLINTLKEESVREYFPHATSHFLGLNPHDTGNYQKPLKPGIVLTVEPGIYIHDEAIGVRIEDDVLITETGAKVLSRGLPSEL